jgi:hypothetical protein
MNYSQRVDAFSKLGDIFRSLNSESPVLQQAYLYNNWFTLDMQLKSFGAWADLLTQEKLNEWTATYELNELASPKKVAIIMAGNIPLVGFHDLLSVLISGNIALVKPSSDDSVLIKWVIAQLLEINAGFSNYIQMVEDHSLKIFDAVIATGSNNSNRYFEYYFRNKPSLLRRTRNSVAVLSGNETADDLDKLADDVFLYFGMGCRNVSKLLVPKGYNLEPMFLAFERYKDIINHNKYANNYTYHKALFLMNQDPHLDNGFLIVKQDDALASPLSVLMFQIFESESDIHAFLELHKDHIQCTVGKLTESMIPFGKSQDPGLSDYADGVDTLQFLKELEA